MQADNPLKDACLACFPGDAPAAVPSEVRAEPDGSAVADYSCPLCGLTWATRWKVAAAFPEVRIYRRPFPLLDEAITLLAVLLDGEELESV